MFKYRTKRYRYLPVQLYKYFSTAFSTILFFNIVASITFITVRYSTVPYGSSIVFHQKSLSKKITHKSFYVRTCVLIAWRCRILFFVLTPVSLREHKYQKSLVVSTRRLAIIDPRFGLNNHTHVKYSPVRTSSIISESHRPDTTDRDAAYVVLQVE